MKKKSNKPLLIEFFDSRLFDLAVDKLVTVKEMEGMGWMDGGGAWEWRRRLLAWEEESVTNCSFLLHDIVLQDRAPNRWRWLLDTVAGYSVKGTYQYITTTDNSLERGRFDVVWQRQVPLKVSVFTWRLLRDRLPTRDNLLHRGIIHQDGTSCIGGCGSSETAAHLILQCDVFGSMWHYVYRWVGISFIAPATVGAHFQHFG